uniref:Uncharacterized protein n=1 Tax=Solanum lycopersicum TaxID=4081 RepID=A0A3Q7FP34_SOLLC
MERKVGLSVFNKNWTIHGLYWGSYKIHQPNVLGDSLKELLAWLSKGLITVNISHTFSLTESNVIAGWRRLAENVEEFINEKSSTKGVAITPRVKLNKPFIENENYKEAITGSKWNQLTEDKPLIDEEHIPMGDWRRKGQNLNLEWWSPMIGRFEWFWIQSIEPFIAVMEF